MIKCSQSTSSFLILNYKIMKYLNILESIGNTPMVKISKLNPYSKASIFAKWEGANPSGSIKDRIAKYMVEKAEQRRELKSGYTIIEATSGNTGISLAMIAAVKGYKMIAVMPENMTGERIKLMKLFGAEIILTSAKKGITGAIKIREELGKKISRVWLPRQFENPDNVRAHEETTGKEILEEVDKIDAFVAGVGTGGTLMGIGKTLKKKFPKVKLVAVEPAEYPHQISGIADGIIPKILDKRMIDQTVKVRSIDAIRMAKRLAKEEGLPVGISSGANVLAALELAKKYKNIVTVLPDRAERYFSVALFKK